jgi:hypothetical protein
MKTAFIANTLTLAGVGVYFGPQIASSLFPLVQEAHVVGVISFGRRLGGVGASRSEKDLSHACYQMGSVSTLPLLI